MKMEPLDSGCLKIWMTHADMLSWGLDFDRMSVRDTATRHAVLKLIHLAQERLALPLSTGMTVEALPLEDGCLLLLTPGHPRCQTRAAQPAVYAIRTADDLLQLGGRLSLLPKHRLPCASLFEWHTGYRLILYPDTLPSTPLRRLVGEFAELIGKGSTTAAYTEEHGSPLVIGNALQRLLTGRESP